MFETLWIDQPDAEAKLSSLSALPDKALLASQFANFREFGFCIIKNAVDPSVIDQYLAEAESLRAADKLKISLGQAILPAKNADLKIPLTKLLDTHWYSKAAQEICFSPKIKDFVEGLFNEPALAFQALHFETGSTQAVHNDTAYVVLDEPKSLCASWVALEDIEPGTGELVYYPGGHRFGEFLYPGNKKSWNAKDDGNAIHDHHLAWLHHRAKELGIQLQSFLPKKGDALMWHADLPHGGGEITKPNSTRRSLVTHYCPEHCTPHFFQFVESERQQKRKVNAGGYVSSFYYR